MHNDKFAPKQIYRIGQSRRPACFTSVLTCKVWWLVRCNWIGEDKYGVGALIKSCWNVTWECVEKLAYAIPIDRWIRSVILNKWWFVYELTWLEESDTWRRVYGTYEHPNEHPNDERRRLSQHTPSTWNPSRRSFRTHSPWMNISTCYEVLFVDRAAFDTHKRI